jgi:hypothetical protein
MCSETVRRLCAADSAKYVDRQLGNPTYATISNPPVAYTPTLYYGNLSTYPQTSGTLGPTTITTLYGNNKPVIAAIWQAEVASNGERVIPIDVRPRSKPYARACSCVNCAQKK